MHLKVVDYLKGYSILTIVLFHLLQYFPLSSLGQKIISFGGSGTHVFILCSGFGLCLSQLNKQLSFREFLKKRFFKIYIPYIIIVLLTALVPGVYKHGNTGIAILSHIFLFKMLNEHWMTSFGYHFWFISMIIQFYLVFPILFKFIIKYRIKTVFLGIVVSILWSTIVVVFGNPDDRIWNSFFLQFLWEFCLGMYLALLLKEKTISLQVPSLKILITCFIAMSGLMLFMSTKGELFKMYNDIPILLSYLSLALIIYTILNKFSTILAFFDFVNDISYELYLVHMITFILVFDYLSAYLPLVPVALIALGISFILAFWYKKFLKHIVFKFLVP